METPTVKTYAAILFLLWACWELFPGSLWLLCTLLWNEKLLTLCGPGRPRVVAPSGWLYERVKTVFDCMKRWTNSDEIDGEISFLFSPPRDCEAPAVYDPFKQGFRCTTWHPFTPVVRFVWFVFWCRANSVVLVCLLAVLQFHKERFETEGLNVSSEVSGKKNWQGDTA